MARGAASLPQGERTTPYRRTHLRLDTPDTYVVEAPFGRSWILDQMASGPDSHAVNVHFLDSVGWELKPYQIEEHYVRERTEGQSGTLQPLANGGQLEVGSGFIQRALFRKPTDLTDATTGANANLVDQGDLFVERTVAAGDSWADQNLAADQTAFPGPTTEENLAMDRVAVLQHTLDNEQALVFRFHVPGSGRQQARVVGRFYFAGPAGYHQSRALTAPGDDAATQARKERARNGTGRYCLTFYGDGRASLQEFCVDDGDGIVAGTKWTAPVYFRYAPSTQVSGRQHTVYIRPVKRQAVTGAWMIVFKCENTSSQAGNLGNMLASFRATSGDTQVYVYRVPFQRGKTPEAQAMAPRVDNRRDQRPKFQISTTRYPGSGVLRCDPFSIPFWPTDTAPLTVIWLADVPDGCTLTCVAYNARTGEALDTTGLEGGERYQQFALEFGLDYFFLEFTFTGPGTATPTLYAVRAQRNGRTETVAPVEVDMVPRTPGTAGLVQRTFGPVSIQSVEGEPYQESGSITIKDVISGITQLETRGDMPFILETEYDEADTEKRSVLLEGYLRVPNRNRRGRGENRHDPYPAADWVEIEAQLIGKWRRIAEQMSNVRFNWHWPDPYDPAGAPFKATDAIWHMLRWAGLDEDQLDIPDLSTRLWPTDNEVDLFVEPGDSVWNYVLAICRDYLGAALVWDGNASTKGAMRLIRATRPPYTRLARFVMHPDAPGGADVVRLAHNMRAYGTFDDDGRDIPNVFCTSHSRRLNPPEANAVLVTGVSLGDWNSYGRLTQWAVNKLSFNFYDGLETADPNHPDYLGRIVPLIVIDPGLNTPEAVRWATRRYYDQTCRAVTIDTLTGPLVLVNDETDTLQREHRKLRWYDPVVCGYEPDDKSWLVRTCQIEYADDVSQMATYELQKPTGPYAD